MDFVLESTGEGMFDPTIIIADRLHIKIRVCTCGLIDPGGITPHAREFTPHSRSCA